MQRLALRLRQPHRLPTSQPIFTSAPTRIPIFIPRIQHRRIAFRHPYSQQNAPRYQPVRFAKPSVFYSRRRQMGLILSFFTSYLLYKWVASHITIEIEMKEADPKDKDQNKKAEEDAEDEDDEEYTFIPLTWGKKMPREFYRGSDPEWQEFVKVAKDKSRHKKIQDALVQQVFRSSQKHPAMQAHLGNNMKIGKYWLDISFPDGPPQDYERYGLEFGASEINWAAERIPPEEQFRLERALLPVAVAKATWAASKAVAGIQYRRLKQRLGIEGIDPFSPEERLRLALEMAEKQQANKQKGRRGSGEIDPAGAVVNRSNPTENPPAAGSDSTKKRFPWQMQVPMPGVESSGERKSMDFPIFQIVFQTTLHKHWNPKKVEPPRGSFVVQGMMEIRGSKGQMLFDVQGCYDPKQAKYVMLSAKKRNFKLWNQRPRGGP